MFDKKRSTKVLKWAKKLKYVKELGSKCEMCGCDDLRCLEFHHDIGEKEKGISILLSSRLDDISSEIQKCKLLCSRCHSIHHHSKNIKEGKRRKNKSILLEYKGDNKCEKCGWNGHQSGLDFHHPNDNKKMTLSEINIRLNSVADIDEYIKTEVDKCSLLCKNCHRIEHCDSSYEDIKVEVKNKEIKQYKKTDHNKVKQMYNGGMTMYAISKELGISKSLVSYIVNK